MEKRRSYTQLRPEDRVVIAGMTRLGTSVRAMARTLERSPSTISRELARNRGPDGGYASQAAHALHGARRVAARPPRKLSAHSVSWGVVRTLLSRELIEESGHEEGSGGGLLSTTDLFVEKLGLRSLADLPPIAPLLPDVDPEMDERLESGLAAIADMEMD